MMSLLIRTPMPSQDESEILRPHQALTEKRRVPWSSPAAADYSFVQYTEIGLAPHPATCASGECGLNTLLKMSERESRALTALARSMRMTQQAQVGPRAAATAVQNASPFPPPWE